MKHNESYTISYIQLIALNIIIFSLLGCATKILDYSKLNYIDRNVIKTKFLNDGILQLPSVSRPGLEYVEEIIDTTLNNSLIKYKPKFFTTPLYKTQFDIATNDTLKTNFNALNRSYLINSPIDKMNLNYISQSTGKRFLLAIYIENFGNKETNSVVVQQQIYLINNVGSLPVGLSAYNLERRGLTIVARIYDGYQGYVIWDRYCEVGAEVNLHRMLQPSDDMNIYIDSLVVGLVNSLPF